MTPPGDVPHFDASVLARTDRQTPIQAHGQGGNPPGMSEPLVGPALWRGIDGEHRAIRSPKQDNIRVRGHRHRRNPARWREREQQFSGLGIPKLDRASVGQHQQLASIRALLPTGYSPLMDQWSDPGAASGQRPEAQLRTPVIHNDEISPGTEFHGDYVPPVSQRRCYRQREAALTQR